MGAITFTGLVVRFGGHPAAALGLDPAHGQEADVAGWLVAAVLLSGARRGNEREALAGWRALAERGLASPPELAARGPLAAAVALAGAGYAHAEGVAPTLARLGETLAAHGPDALVTLLRDAEGLDDLAARIAALAPGLGRATVERFLRPLRERSVCAGDLPLAAAARAAAVCLGLLREGEDEDGAPGVLRRRLGEEPGAPELADVEAALERLGAQACTRKRPEACPMAATCPRR
jgi:hypothetical protein